MSGNFQKQVVQWFPGHMAKTRRQIKESLSLVDAVTVLLDARVPFSSQNPEISEIVSNKPVIYLLNKSDVADEKTTEQWLEHYKKQGIPALAVDCKNGKGLNKYRATIREVLKEKIESNKQKNMEGKPLRVMIVGIPNTGKSSLINRLAGTKKAKVADKPGVTKQNQWYVIGDGIELLDTPGVLWPKFDDPSVGNKLAFIGSVKDEIIDIEILAVRLLEVLTKFYPDRVKERYKIDNFENLQAYEVLELIGKKRGMLISGGEVNTERAAITLLDEYRAGMLGKISMEKPF